MAKPEPDVRPLISAIDARLSVVASEIKKLTDELKALTDERQMLVRTREHYEKPTATSGAASAPTRPKAVPVEMTPEAPAIFSQLGLTEAVRLYIRQFPGHMPSQVMDALEPVVKTASKNRRKIISWTITDLTKRGEISRHEDGTLHPYYVQESLMP